MCVLPLAALPSRPPAPIPPRPAASNIFFVKNIAPATTARLCWQVSIDSTQCLAFSRNTGVAQHVLDEQAQLQVTTLLTVDPRRGQVRSSCRVEAGMCCMSGVVRGDLLSGTPWLLKGHAWLAWALRWPAGQPMPCLLFKLRA